MALVPWSPLQNGFLSGKYRRDAQVTDSARAAFVGGPSEDEFGVIDAVAADRRRARHHLRGGVAGLAARPAGAPSCPSSAPGAWSTSTTTSPAWRWRSPPNSSGTLDEVSAPTLNYPAPMHGAHAGDAAVRRDHRRR